MKLYELTQAYQNIQGLLDDESMDLAVIQQAMQEIEGQIEVKCENSVIIMQGLTGEIEMFKAEEKRLSERRRTLENKRDWLKGYLHAELEKMGLEKVKAGTFTVSLQSNPAALKITDETLIPAAYMTIIPQKVVPNNATIKDALKAGEIVPGAELTQGKSLRVR